jgi:hypothetical protein
MHSFYHPDRSGVVSAESDSHFAAFKRRICGFLAKNKSLPRLVERDSFADLTQITDHFFCAIRWKALPSAGFAKVDFVKSGFQRT